MAKLSLKNILGKKAEASSFFSDFFEQIKCRGVD